MVEGQLTLFEPVDPFTGEKMQEISPSIEGLLVNVARLVVFYSRDLSPRQVTRLIVAEQEAVKSSFCHLSFIFLYDILKL